MRKERIWTVVMLSAVALIVALIMVMEIIDRPENGQNAVPYKSGVTMTKSQSKYRNEDGSDSTYYGYYELKEEEENDDSSESTENEKTEVNVNQAVVDFKSYDEKVNWGVKSATNDMKSTLMIAGVEAITGDVSSAAGDVTQGIGSYMGDLYESIAP